MPAAAPMLALALAWVLSLLATSCARLPVLALAGRLRVVTHEHAAAQSMALVVGCGFKLERDALERASVDEPPPGVPAKLDAPPARCTDEALCSWQHASELHAAYVLLPLADEDNPCTTLACRT